MVTVEGLNLRRERDVALPSRRHQHTERVEHVAPVALEQVQRFVEAGRVRALVPDDRPHFGGQRRRARLHPCSVAEQRIDLTVMCEEAERLSELPGRERIGRVTLVEDRDGALVFRVAEVGEEGGKLGPGEERFVDDGAAG